MKRLIIADGSCGNVTKLLLATRLSERRANSQPLAFAGSRTRLNIVREVRRGLESENNYSDILVFASPGVCKTGGEYEEVDGATLPLASRSDGCCANQFAGARGHGLDG